MLKTAVESILQKRCGNARENWTKSKIIWSDPDTLVTILGPTPSEMWLIPLFRRFSTPEPQLSKSNQPVGEEYAIKLL